MKKVLAFVFVVSMLFSSVGSAATCTGDYHIFKAFINVNGQYQFYRNYLSAEAVINDVQANPSISGKVTSQDASCDKITTWLFANGDFWLVR